MELGITGLSKSGRTTVFNARTRRRAQTSSCGEASSRPKLGVAKMPAYLDALADMLHPEHVVQTKVQYVDIPSPATGIGRSRGLVGGTNDSGRQSSAELIITLTIGWVVVGKQDHTTKGTI